MDHTQTVQLTLLVTNYDDAIEFYCSKTGLFRLEIDFEFAPNSRHVVLSFADPKVLFTLGLELATTAEEKHAVGRQGGGHALLSVPIASFKQTYDELVARVVTFVDGPHYLPFGIQGTFVDPFGNRICISESFRGGRNAGKD